MKDKKETKELKKRLSIELDEFNHMEIKLAAASRGLTIKKFVENALYAYGKIINKKES